MEYWQDFTDAPVQDAKIIWRDRYAAPMPDRRALWLPLRDLGAYAVAGLIANQVAFRVLDRLVAWLTEAVAPYRAEILFGLPTLGHAVAPALARALGHTRWIAAGHSRKLWYDEALSVSASSITTPDARRMWLDPRTLPVLRGRRVLLVDDVISTGRSMRAGLALLRAAGVEPVGAAVLMRQTERWREGWDCRITVESAFATPLFTRAAGGWAISPD